jgi:hypothetical protein
LLLLLPLLLNYVAISAANDVAAVKIDDVASAAAAAPAVAAALTSLLLFVAAVAGTFVADATIAFNTFCCFCCSCFCGCLKLFLFLFLLLLLWLLLLLCLQSVDPTDVLHVFGPGKTLIWTNTFLKWFSCTRG